MNKFRRFLGRISADTYLKLDYFGSHIKITGWCRWLANFGQKRSLHFLPSPLQVQKTFQRHCFMLASNRAYLLLFLGRQPCTQTQTFYSKASCLCLMQRIHMQVSQLHTEWTACKYCIFVLSRSRDIHNPSKLSIENAVHKNITQSNKQS